MTRPRTLLAVAAVLLTAAVSGCSASADGGGAKGYVTGDGAVTIIAAADRTAPGEVAGTDLDGNPVALSDYAGKVVVINVWGAWCADCRKEAPDLVAAARELSGRDVAFLGINTRDASPAQARGYVRRFEVPFPSIYDQGGTTLLAFDGTLAPSSIPSTVVIDRQGRVAASILGTLPSKQTLVDLVEGVRDDTRSG